MQIKEKSTGDIYTFKDLVNTGQGIFPYWYILVEELDKQIPLNDLDLSYK